MKSIKTMAALAAGLAFAVSSHAATYSFSGFFGEPSPPGDDYTATFSFSLPAPITADATVAAASMSQCRTPLGACIAASFYVDAAAAGLAPGHPDWEAVSLSNTDGYTVYWYFDATTFTTDGAHDAVFGDGPATLTALTSALPEPAPASLALAGLALLGTAPRRRAAR